MINMPGPLLLRLATSATVTVGGVAGSALDVAGVGAAVVSSLIAAAGLAFGLAASARHRRQEWDEEIRKAKLGVRQELSADLEQSRRDAEYWRGVAISGLRPGTQLPNLPQRMSDNERDEQ